VPAFFAALSNDFKCHMKPMSTLNDEEAAQLPEDEAYLAMKHMQEDSYHDSVHVVRNYENVNAGFQKRHSLLGA